MTIYMSRLFPKSNSSFLLTSGKAMRAEVSRFKDDIYLVDAGIGTPKMTMPEELRRVPISRGATRFENKVGFMDATAGESLVKTQMLERFFMDLVAGEPAMKERATARFSDLIGSTDAVPGEPAILLPRRFTQNQAWTELKKIWQSNRKVRGFLMEKVKGGYSVAIAGAEVAVLCITKSGDVLNYQAFTNSRGIYTVAETMPESERWDACLARLISSFHEHCTHLGDGFSGVKFSYNHLSGYSHAVKPFVYRPASSPTYCI